MRRSVATDSWNKRSLQASNRRSQKTYRGRMYGRFMDMMNKNLANMQNNLDKITNQSVENSEFLLRQMGFSKSIGQGVTDNASNFPTTK